LRGGRTEAACADHERVRRGELLLRTGAELVQQDVPAVAQELRVGKLDGAGRHRTILRASRFEANSPSGRPVGIKDYPSRATNETPGFRRAPRDHVKESTA
jgi:hypothetical protein